MFTIRSHSGLLSILFAAGALSVTGCQSAHKATATRQEVRGELCAEAWLAYPDQPHPMWTEISHARTFPSATVNSVPDKYKAYRINEDTLKAYFALYRKASGNTGLVIPMGNACETFVMRRSGSMSPELQQKYGDIISLQGNGTTDKASDLRIDWDGSALRGQILANGQVYLIAPYASSEGRVYLIYNKDNTTEQKQPFEQKQAAPPAGESNKKLYDR